MIICSCNVLSDKEIRKSLLGPNPPRTPAQAHRRCGCKPQCGRCVRSVRAIIEESRREAPAGTQGAEVVRLAS